MEEKERFEVLTIFEDGHNHHYIFDNKTKIRSEHYLISKDKASKICKVLNKDEIKKWTE